MKFKPVFYAFLKKLPLILAVLMAPLTLLAVIHFEPVVLEFFQPGRSPEVEETSSAASSTRTSPGGTPSANGIDWRAEADRCRTADDLVRLARRAQTAGAVPWPEVLYLRALRTDPQHVEAHVALGDTLFSPRRYLEDYRRLSTELDQADLEPFADCGGQWLTAGELAKVRARWNVLRQRTTTTRDVGRPDTDSGAPAGGPTKIDADLAETLRKRPMLAELLDSGTLRADRGYPPYLFILEGRALRASDQAAPFLNTLSTDLSGLLAAFRETCLNPTDADRVAEETYRVVVLENEDRYAALIEEIEDSPGMARLAGSDRALYDPLLGLLVTSLPEDRILYSASLGQRRATIAPLGRLLIDRFSRTEPKVWLVEGTARHLALGQGLDARGALNLNGEGILFSDRFAGWIGKAGRGWPIPLERLVEYNTYTGLEKACSNRRGHEGALEACALFCRWMIETYGKESFRDFVSGRLAGRSGSSDVAALLQGRAFDQVEAEMRKRFTRPDQQLAGSNTGRSSSTPSARHDRGRSESSDRKPSQPQGAFLSEEEILGFLDPAADPEVFRPVILYLVKKHGHFKAYRIVEQHLAGASIAPTSALAGDLDYFTRTATGLDERFRALTEKKFDLRIGRIEARLERVTAGELICAAHDQNIDLNALPRECFLTREGRIRCPFNALDLSFVVGRFKNVLGATDDNDRLFYSLLHLFETDGARFMNELAYLDANHPEKKPLGELFSSYSKAIPGASLFAALAGEKAGDPADVVDAISKPLQRLKDDPLFDALDQPRLDGILRQQIHKSYLHENEYLWSTYSGFRGSGGGVGSVRFVYDFEDRDQRDDLEFKEDQVTARIAKQLEAPTVLAPESFRVLKNTLTCYGSDSVALEPVFSGDIRIILSIRFTPKRVKNLMEPYYIYCGYGLDEQGRYIASCCLNGLDIDGTSIGSVDKQCPERLAVKKTYTLTLTGYRNAIVHDFDGATQRTAQNGQRKGRVFLWVNGPRWFHIEKLEVQGDIDRAWLDSRIEPLVEERIEKILK